MKRMLATATLLLLGCGSSSAFAPLDSPNLLRPRTPGGACLPKLAEGAGGCCGGGLLALGAGFTLTITWGRVASEGGAVRTLPLYYGMLGAVWATSAALGVHAVGDWIRTGRFRLAPRGRPFERTLLFSILGTAVGVVATEARIYQTSGSLRNFRLGNGSWIAAIPFATVAFAIYGEETAPAER